MPEKILLIRPYYGVNIHTDAQGEFGTILNSNDIFPDLPLINAATVIDQSDDHEVIIIDAAAERMLPDELLDRISATEFDVAVVKAAAPSIRSDIEVIKRIKKEFPGCKAMIAGQAAKILKKWLYANTPVDTVIEEPVDLYFYRYVNRSDASINDLPSPDYSLVDHTRYTDDYNNIRLTIQASRGCPMGCRYCPYIQFYDAFEMRDVEKVFEDFKAAAVGADIIQFRDQFFTCNKAKIRELCHLIIDSGIKVRWICETRLDSLDADLVKLMKDAGLFLICFGVESGDKQIIEEYNSNKGDLKDQKDGIALINSLGIMTMAFYIIGFPEDTWESIEKTYRYADEINSDITAFNEYCDFDLSGLADPSPDIFVPFENMTVTARKSNLSREEIRYAIELFSTMYTLKHDPLQKAYEYNHKLVENSRKLASEISGYDGDLDLMSRQIRLINSRDRQ